MNPMKRVIDNKFEEKKITKNGTKQGLNSLISIKYIIIITNTMN